MGLNIEELESFTALNCEGYDATWFERILVTTRYSPLIITLVMYVSGLWYRELYLLLFGVGLTLDNLLNKALQMAIDERVPQKSCGGPLGMPSELAQHIAFFYAMLVTFPILYSQRMGLSKALILALGAALVYAAQVELGYNTPEQVLVGSVVGTLFGFVYQLVIYTLLYPYFNTILSWSLVDWCGYADSWCRVPRREPVALEPHSTREFLRTQVWPLVTEYFIFPENTDILVLIEDSIAQPVHRATPPKEPRLKF